MYFKSLTNDELQHFHKLTNIRNFSISLTEILDSELFKKEEITTGLYRIYPLFYCEEILTNDTSTKLMENKCILTTLTDEEKYFNFITDKDAPVIYDGYDYFTIGDHLTTSEFNAFVQVLKSKLNITDNIRATDGTVKGNYGDYKFDLTDVTIVDNGILITEETLSANPTVKLIHPIFRNSTYTLKLDVFSVSDVNVMDDYNTDNITHDTLEVVLEENTDVAISLGSLDFNKIVSFNAVIDIVHDQPVIQYPGSLELTVETDNYIDTTVEASVLYKDSTGAVLARELLTLRDGETVLTTATTGDDGVATFEYTPTQDKEYNFNVISEGGLVSNNIVKNIVKHSVNITSATNKNPVYIPSTFIFSGVVSSDYGVMENATLKIMNNNEVIGTAYTNALGEYSREMECNSAAEYNLKAVYEGNSTHYASSSSFVNVVARKLNTNITINTNRNIVYHTQNLVISGVLKDELGNPISGATVTLKGGSSDATRTTNSNGEYSFTRNYSSAGGDYGKTFNYYVVYAGDGSHAGVTSATKSIPIRKAPTSISTTIPSELNAGDTLPIKVVSSYGSFNPSSVTVKTYNYNQRPQPGSWIDNPIETFNLTEKNANGNFNFTVPYYENNYYDIVIKYDGTDDYAASSKESSPYIHEADVSSITARKSGTNFYAKFKDSDGNALAGAHLSNVTIYITLNGQTITSVLSTAILDSNGEVYISGLPTGCSCYATYGGVTSNTVTF